jgi:radical SAM superfamily enzyme YgiQ (UPF0313 family)
MLNSLDYVYAERVVASSMAGREPPPRSIETSRPLKDFDLVIAPISYELDYVTLLRLLLSAGIDASSSERRRKHQPLIVVGGPVPSSNPVVAREISDLVLIGEAEPLVPRLVEEAYTRGAWDAFDVLACLPGFLPASSVSCGRRVKRVWIRNLDKAYHTTMQFRVPGSGEPWGEAYMVEASRGCPHMCRFCMEAHFLMPLRHRSKKRILELIERGLGANRVRKVAFYALSFFDHPNADELLEEVIESFGAEATIGSLRADQLDEERLALIARAGQRHVAIAPETFSPRLCKALGKCIPLEKTQRVSVEAWRRGLKVKLYLMLGLPGESDRDVEMYASILRELSKRAPPMREALRVSVNPLIPKPFTPLQFHKLISEKDYMRRIGMLRTASSRVLSVDALSYRYAYAQAVIARGDERLARVLIEWAKLGGRLGQLRIAARRQGVDTDEYAYTPTTELVYKWHSLVDNGVPFKTLMHSYNTLTISITTQS